MTLPIDCLVCLHQINQGTVVIKYQVGLLSLLSANPQHLF